MSKNNDALKDNTGKNHIKTLVDNSMPSLHLKSASNIDNEEELFNIYAKEISLLHKLDNVNQKPFLTLKNKEEIKLFHDFCAKTELLKVNFLCSFMAVNELVPYDESSINTVLEPFIPSCSYNRETNVFDMDLDFAPYLKFNTIKDFSKVKNVVVRLITEGINRMKTKPKYNKEAVLIIFTLYSPYIFDVDNIEVKYIIDAFRYAGFFYDDSYKYVSYMVRGKSNKHPLIKVKIIPETSAKIV